MGNGAAATDGDGLAAELEETWSSIAELGDRLDDAQWAAETACPGWSVKDHLAHMLGTEAMLAGRRAPEGPEAVGDHVRNDIGRSNEAWVASRRAVPGPELLAELRAVTAERLGQLRGLRPADFAADSWTPAGPGTYGRFMQIRVFDCWVHEQDMRRAVGMAGHGSGPAAEQAVDEVSRAIGYVVGKKGRAPDGSRILFDLRGPVTRQLRVAVDGRAGLVGAFDGDPTASVASDSLTFMALACGRLDPKEALADGRVALGGDEALGGQLVSNLGYTI